jgi:predicted transcriptional regulator
VRHRDGPGSRVQALAESEDPRTIKLADICSRDVTSLSPESSVGGAVKLMRDKAVRRLPVLENGKPVGTVSIGDLAVRRDPDSALADISAAPANN